MQQRFEKACELINVRGGVVDPLCTGIVVPAQQAIAFASSEVDLALQSRDPAPELAEAEAWLRRPAKICDPYDDRMRVVLAAELGRLRNSLAAVQSDNEAYCQHEMERAAEVLDLKQQVARQAAELSVLHGEAQRTVWVGANSVVEAINKVRRARSYNTLEAATGIRGGPYWEVTLTARRCEEPRK